MQFLLFSGNGNSWRSFWIWKDVSPTGLYIYMILLGSTHMKVVNPFQAISTLSIMLKHFMMKDTFLVQCVVSPYNMAFSNWYICR